MAVCILIIKFATNITKLRKMTKENIEKISVSNTFWAGEDISVEEKKLLADYLSKKGFTSSTFYLRFFQKGFSAWEISGIKNCKKQFLDMPEVSKLLSAYQDTKDDNGGRVYLYTFAHSDAPGVFYDCLKKVNGGLCNKFFAFMGERGMSMATVVKRFTSDNWKVWEADGIRKVLCQYMNEKSKCND